jgi:hypothetical protein
MQYVSLAYLQFASSLYALALYLCQLTDKQQCHQTGLALVENLTCIWSVLCLNLVKESCLSKLSFVALQPISAEIEGHNCLYMPFNCQFMICNFLSWYSLTTSIYRCP